MDSVAAGQIIEALIKGINPITGEELADDGFWNEADVIRALHMASQALQPVSGESKPSKKKERTGKPWLGSEDDQLKNEFAAGTRVADMALAHGRTTGGIKARLVRLGLIEERSDAQ